MKKLFNIKLSVAIIIFSLVVLYSCDEDEFLDRYPLDSPSPENFFINASSAQSAITAAFNPWWNSAFMYRRDLVIIMDAMTDDSYWRPSRSGSIQQERWDITPTHGPMGTYWSQAFSSINAANFAIEGIPTSSDPSFNEAAQQPYIAQARFMRAFSYLFLTTLYGDVPLITNPLSSFEEFHQPRASKSEVFEQIIQDFKFAIDNLPESWSNAIGAPTKATAAAYLAKTYLYNEDYVNAESAARDAILIAESTGYALIDNYESIFSEDNEKNPELLFYISYQSDVDGFGQNATIQRIARDVPGPMQSIWGSGGWGYALPQRDLYDAYEEGDPRREYTMYAPGDVFGTFSESEPFTYTHQKFDENTGEEIEYEVTYNPGDPVEYDHRWSPTGLNVKKSLSYVGDLTNVRWDGLDVPLMRMADLYLFLAEALAEQGKAEALDWVNKVRARPSVDMPPKTTADGDLVDIVRHERRVELAMEGLRLFDLMRWENLGEIFATPTSVKRHFYSDVLPDANTETRFDAPSIELPTNLLFPIPQSEIDQNDEINTNNPGYD